MPEAYYDRYFPALKRLGFTRTSEAEYYNCIAYAAGDIERRWWPDQFPPGSRDYWPLPLTNPPDERVETFIAEFATQGYVPCENARHEPGYEKVAYYAEGETVRHAAKQHEDGAWRSKLGPDEDIEHTLEGLEGWFYGRVVAILRRPIPRTEQIASPPIGMLRRLIALLVMRFRKG